MLRGLFLLFFSPHPSEVWVGEKNSRWVKPPPRGPAVPAKPPAPSHLKHFLRHGLSPLLGDGDLRVGIEEDFDDLRHGRAGLQHLVVGNARRFRQRCAAQRGRASTCCTRGLSHPTAVQAGIVPCQYEAGVGFVLARFGDLSPSVKRWEDLPYCGTSSSGYGPCFLFTFLACAR